MCADSWSDVIDQKVFNAESFLISSATNWASSKESPCEMNTMSFLSRPCTDLFFHTVNEAISDFSGRGPWKAG